MPNPIELITIQKNFHYSGSEPGQTDNWQTYCTVYAELQVGQGREFFGAKKVNSELDGILKTNQYIRGVDSSMRAVCSLGTFEIKAVIPLLTEGKVEFHVKRVS